MQLKRQHSAEPLANEPSSARKSPFLKTEDSGSASTPASTAATAGTPPESRSPVPPSDPPAETIGSPYKRHRASLPAGGLDGGILGAQGMFGVGSQGPGEGMFSTETISGVMPGPPLSKEPPELGAGVKDEGQTQTHSVPPAQQQQQVKMEDDEEL